MGSRGMGSASFGSGSGPGAHRAAAIICGESAWSYHATPPLLREAALPPGAADLPALRANAREADARIYARLLTDLKGVPLPADVMVGRGSNRDETRITRPRIISSRHMNQDVVMLDSGLAVETPLASLLTMAASRTPAPRLTELLMEGLGIYAVHKETQRSRAALNRALRDNVICSEVQKARPDRIREFRDAQGSIVSFLDRGGHVIPWELAFDRFGRPTNHWKRSPLFTRDDLEEFLQRHAGSNGAKLLSRAARNALDGSASVLETRSLILMCGDAWMGGEGLPWPETNARVDFSETGRTLSKGAYCSCDQLWRSKKVIVEEDGKAFHADALGFSLESGRTAALQSMGYTVIRLTYEQVADLDQFEPMVRVIAEALGVRLKVRSRAFLERRKRLHEQLFPHGRR